jgi:hypothetical protein
VAAKTRLTFNTKVGGFQVRSMVRNSDHSSTVQSIKGSERLGRFEAVQNRVGESLLREAGTRLLALICGSSDAHRGKGQAKR